MTQQIENRPATNRRLAKKRVQCLIEHSASYLLLIWVDSFVLRDPLLRQARKPLCQYTRYLLTLQRISIKQSLSKPTLNS
jgi:hypothetical protein